jgi:hypothetical protein
MRPEGPSYCRHDLRQDPVAIDGVLRGGRRMVGDKVGISAMQVRREFEVGRLSS